MTYREAVGHSMTIGERIARMKPTEIITDGGGISTAKGRPSAKTMNHFICAECGKDVELRMDQSVEAWAYKISHKYKHHVFCSYSCMRAYERTCKGEWKNPPLRRSCIPWTLEQDRMICDLYYNEGISCAEIGKRLNPPRSSSSVYHRLLVIRTDYIAGLI